MYPSIPLAMQQKDFWINKLVRPDSLVMSSTEIEACNALTRQRLPAHVFDLAQYPAYIAGEAIQALISKNAFPEEPGYVEGLEVAPEYYDLLWARMNLASLRGIFQVAYGFTLKRTNIRAFPTDDFFTKSPDDREFDRFQETALDPAEPLVVLHHSSDSKWLFVQSYNYCGWAPQAAVATTVDRSLWLSYINHSQFLVVTGNWLALGQDPYMPQFSELHFAMGSKLLLARPDCIPEIINNRSTAGNYAVWLPARGADGTLDFRLALVPWSSDVSVGYLPFTRQNILTQAFKMQGNRYGWGGLFGTRDCSAFILDTYRSFGIILPRNAREQALGAGTRTSLKSKNTKERCRILRSLAPGATLHLPGHVMLYLGEQDRRFYVIHAIAACGDPNRPRTDGTFETIPLNGVMVTDLSLLRANGMSLLEALTEVNQIGC